MDEIIRKIQQEIQDIITKKFESRGLYYIPLELQELKRIIFEIKKKFDINDEIEIICDDTNNSKRNLELGSLNIRIRTKLEY